MYLDEIFTRDRSMKTVARVAMCERVATIVPRPLMLVLPHCSILTDMLYVAPFRPLDTGQHEYA